MNHRHLDVIDREIEKFEERLTRKESLAETYGLLPFCITLAFGLGALYFLGVIPPL
jgi:hypothetical protein